MTMLDQGELTVSGGATAEELAAVIAALGMRPQTREVSAYEKWRRARQASLSRPDDRGQTRS